MYPVGATPLDQNEIQGLIPEISTQAELNELEKENIRQAIRWAKRSRLVRKELLSPSTLFRLHKEMLQDVWDWAGQVRRTEKNIGVAPHQIAPSLLNLCQDAQYWIEHKVYNWEEIAVRLHHRLVLIHPLANGNCRHARITADLLLSLHEQGTLTWGRSELTQNDETRKEYLGALREADNDRFEELVLFAKS